MISTESGTVTEAMSKAQFDMLTAAGKITGNKYTYTIAADEKDIAKENERIVGSFNHSISGLKTNADKTKFYWEVLYTDKEGNVTSTGKCYLEKKSGSSTPVTLPNSNDDDDSVSSTNEPTSSPQQDKEMFEIHTADIYKGELDGYYSFWEGEDNFCFYIGEADLEKFIAYFTFSESDYDIDETAKKFVLTASGIEKFEEQTETVYAGEGEKSTAHSSSKDYDEKN